MNVRDQGDRPTCLAFAASDMHRYHHDLNDWLSPEYLYHRAGDRIPNWTTSDGISLSTVIAALEIDGQPMETDCPYQDVPSLLVVPIGASNAFALYQCTSDLGRLTAGKLYKRGLGPHIFILVLNITDQFHQVISPPYIIDLDKSPFVGRHAVVLAGLAETNTKENLFLIKNSWGEDWGDNGYVWITAKYLNKHIIKTVEI